MLTTLFFLTLMLLISLGNLALGFGVAVHLGQGPAGGWQAIFGGKSNQASASESPPADSHSAH